MPTVSLRISEEQAEKLEEYRNTFEYKIPKSEIIRTALDEHLEEHAE